MHISHPQRTELDFGFLPIGRTRRPHNESIKPPHKVSAASDLPARLLVGSLQRFSFLSNEQRWSARYQGAEPDTHVLIQYNRDKDLLETAFQWRGVGGLMTLGPGDSWKDLHMKIATGFPHAWHLHARPLVEQAYNARYIQDKDHSTRFVGFPDGPFHTILLPVPVDRLDRLLALFDAIDDDARIAVPAHIYATLTDCRVDYLTDRCPDVPHDPPRMAQFAREATGLSCTDLPRLAKGDDQRAFLMVNRKVYLAQISCAFRDTLQVLEHAHRLGLISRNDAQAAPSDYPQGEEWSALVIPGGYEQLGLRLHYYDRGNTRRINYGTILRDEYRAQMFDERRYERDAVESLVMALCVAGGDINVSANSRRVLS